MNLRASKAALKKRIRERAAIERRRARVATLEQRALEKVATAKSNALRERWSEKAALARTERDALDVDMRHVDASILSLGTSIYQMEDALRAGRRRERETFERFASEASETPDEGSGWRDLARLRRE